jgi:hypothetical protein
VSDHDDFEVEPVPGLPEHLPQGEHILWQGAPSWRSLAIHAFHVRKVALYFGLLALWFIADAIHAGASTSDTLVTLGIVVALGCGAVAILAGIAWLTARATVYTVTSRRLIMRFGVALRLTLNVPFSIMQAVSMRRFRDGTGDIPIMLSGPDKASWAVLWPHARPWRLSAPQPMLRGVAEPAIVAQMLGRAITAEDRPDEVQSAVAPHYALAQGAAS